MKSSEQTIAASERISLGQDYHSNITANITAKEAFDKISRVPEWWTKNFKGKTQMPGDAFTVRFGETFVDFKIAEVIPDKKSYGMLLIVILTGSRTKRSGKTQK